MNIRARTQFGIAEFIAELSPAAALDASARGLSFHVEAGHAGVKVDADRSLLAATVVNLLQNAFKFTRPGTTVTLRSSATPDRVLIEVEDECGGLPDGNTNALFHPFEQRGADRTGLGLGLAISRSGAEANNGRICARDLPGHGCIFIIDLPRAAVSLSAPSVNQDVAPRGVMKLRRRSSVRVMMTSRASVLGRNDRKALAVGLGWLPVRPRREVQ